MKNKWLIVILIIILILAIIIINPFETEYKNITINNIDFSVPNSNDIVNNYNEVTFYESRDISIYCFNLTNDTLFNMEKIRGNEVVVDNVTMNKTSDGNYSYYYTNDSTQFNIVIIAKNPHVLAHTIKSMNSKEHYAIGDIKIDPDNQKWTYRGYGKWVKIN